MLTVDIIPLSHYLAKHKMREKLLKIEEITALLQREIKKHGSAKAFCITHKIKKQEVSAVLTGKRLPSRAVLRILGYEKVTRFKPVK